MIWLVLFMGVIVATVHAQKDTVLPSKKANSKLRKAAENLSRSYSNDNEQAIAKDYEKLSEELAAKGDYEKAETYLKQAVTIYTRLNDKEALANASRNLAKLQESQKKIQPAIDNYEAAAKSVKDTSLELVNRNDANRLRNDNPQKQESLIQSNIDILEQKGKQQEVADAYKQLAESQLKQNNTSDAVVNYKKAIANTVSKEAILDINKKISKAYVAGNETASAIAVSETALQQAVAQKNFEQQVILLNDLSELYTKNQQVDKAMAALNGAYDVAITHSNTLGAKTTVQAMSRLLQQQNNLPKSILLHNNFLSKLDSLIKTDSTLVDAKLFEVTEARIQELENEKKLQAELITRKNVFNYVLTGSVILLVILMGLVARAWFAISKKNKKIALQSLRREMNPHFIFNSLNSVNQYIAQNNELEANRFLSSYSSLMRNVMENSNKDFVPLSVEIDQLKKYLELEHQRFMDKFDYTISIDKQIDPDAVMVPNMLIQPHLENAIWHGLRYKTEKGTLTLGFTVSKQTLEVLIEDDGIGLQKSKQLKTQHQKAHQSRGISNTKERIDLLNDIYKAGINMSMTEIADSNTSGTRVLISVPIIYKNSPHAKN